MWKVLTQGNRFMHTAINEACRSAIEEAESFAEQDPVHGHKPAELIRKEASTVLKYIDTLALPHTEGAWQILDGSTQHDGPMSNGTCIIVEEEGYGVGTVDGYQSNLVGANTHSIVFDGCVACRQSGTRAPWCGACRKTMSLQDAKWSHVDGTQPTGSDQMKKGTRIVVENKGYGVGTIDGWRAHRLAPMAANYHTVVFDGCVSCQTTGGPGCGACRKELQLKGTKWHMLARDPGVTTGIALAPMTHADDYAMLDGEARATGAIGGLAGGVAGSVVGLGPAGLIAGAAMPVALTIHNQMRTATGEGVHLRLEVGQVPSTESARELEAIGIHSLTLQRNTGIGIFAYQIKFENDRLGSFAFTDETGDVYKMTAFRKKSHSIAYNSEAPTIVNVKSF